MSNYELTATKPAEADLNGVEAGEAKKPEVKKNISSVSLVSQEEVDAVTWAAVCDELAIWSKDPKRVAYTFMRIFLVLFLLYMFLFFLDMMGTSFKVLGGCAGGELFDGLENPIAGLMVGILATVFVQSSSTSTSMVVSLVGAGSMSVKVGIPVIMGANIGTSVTNTIVSMYYVNEGDHLERAFAAATVHDMFNMCTVALLLPLELIIMWFGGCAKSDSKCGGLLFYFSDAVKPDKVGDGDKWEGPLKKIVSPLTKEFIIANKDVMKYVAQGKTTCKAIYETHKTCADSIGMNYSASNPKYMDYECPGYEKGLIKAGCSNVRGPRWASAGASSARHCDQDGDKPYYITPAFWDKYATQGEDMASATATLIISLIGLCTCMACLVKILSYMSQNSNAAMLQKAARMDPFFAIAVGTGVTILVQSSSITTSVLTPLAASGIITLEQMLPLTLGANIGTTCTGFLASLVSSKVEAVQIAICHLTFNILGIIIWFGLPIPMKMAGGPGICFNTCLETGPGYDYFWPVPFPYKREDGTQLQMRDIPLNCARALGNYTRTWNTFPIYYVLTMFVIIPGILFGISTLFEGKAAEVALGWIVVIFLVIAITRLLVWLYKQDGFAVVAAFMEKRQKSMVFRKNLEATVAELQAEVAALKGAPLGSAVGSEL